ncbi:MAG: sigma-70 family RNA polymerase sigma factor [Planctomycetota bacterium]
MPPAILNPNSTPDNASTLTDEELIERYRDGDKPAFDVLVGRYERELFHFLIRFLGNRASAEDVYQEALLQVSQSAASFDVSRRFRPWLFTIAANKGRDLLRAQARKPAAPLSAKVDGGKEGTEFVDLMVADVEVPDEPLQKQELREAVQSAVMELPEHLREIILLSYFHQFPYKQISEILQIPLGTVKSRLHAAVAHFADKWKRHGTKFDGMTVA